jgi:hypothetical protein
MGDTERDAPPDIGFLCRCARCCCPPGRGHHDPRWVAYEAEQRALERHESARESGLSEYEAREEGWPSAPQSA